MDQSTQNFFMQVFTILGFTENKEQQLQYFLQNSFRHALYLAQSKMEEAKKQVLQKALSMAQSKEALDLLLQKSVTSSEYVQLLHVGSQLAFADMLRQRGTELSEKEKKDILACIPGQVQHVSSLMQSSPDHSLPIAPRRR